jgi:hypothetical protein
MLRLTLWKLNFWVIGYDHVAIEPESDVVQLVHDSVFQLLHILCRLLLLLALSMTILLHLLLNVVILNEYFGQIVLLKLGVLQWDVAVLKCSWTGTDKINVNKTLQNHLGLIIPVKFLSLQVLKVYVTPATITALPTQSKLFIFFLFILVLLVIVHSVISMLWILILCIVLGE